MIVRVTQDAVTVDEANKRALELIGKYVIPEFRAPKAPVWENEYEHHYGVPVPSNVL